MSESAAIREVKMKLGLTEIGVIVSLICSFSVGVFSAGIVYAQVQQNTSRNIEDRRLIDKLDEDVKAYGKQIERIDANVSFLIKLAEEDRNKR